MTDGPQGIQSIWAQAAETMRSRAVLAPGLGVLADVHVKHADPPAGSRLGLAARDAWYRGQADALIVSGSGTGDPTGLDDALAVKEAVPEAAVIVGSGLTLDNGMALLGVADGAIVGSAVMEGGRAGAAIDADRARSLIAALRPPV